jgi:hypothetical protein
MACSTQKPSDSGNQEISEKSPKGISETRGMPVAVDDTHSIEINPSDASRNSTLNLTIKGGPPDAKIEWLVNGNPAVPQALLNQFKTTETMKGDRVQAKAIIGEREILSNTVTIKNTPPELSRVKIMPETFKPGDKLYVDAAGSDIDGDDVSITFEWTKNGEPAGNSKEIDAEIKRGDRISVKITPYDGETYGSSIILKREIRNLPPMIATENKSVFDGKTYTYQINAVDPDDDQLTYSLKDGPEGMTINPANGLITWEVPHGDTENHNIKVLVSDNQGGELLVPFTLKISPEKENKKIQQKTK